MSSKNNYNVFNTAIEDYSIDELYNLLELEELSRENIILKVHDLNANVFKNNEHIKVFFVQAQNKLLNHLSNSDSELDYYLHNNANNNIESNPLENFSNNTAHTTDTDADTDIDADADSDADADADNKLIETYVNYSNSDNVNSNSDNVNSNSNNVNSNSDNVNSNSDNVNSNSDNVNLNSDNSNSVNSNSVNSNSVNSNSVNSNSVNSTSVETYYIHKNLYFNTSYRINKNIENALPTDCKITLTNTINNVVQCKLTSLNIRKPFLIHSTKSNNTFIVKKYNSTNQVNLEFSIVIENGYYENTTEMEDIINNKFKNTIVTTTGEIVDLLTTTYNSATINEDISTSKFMKSLTFSINKNTKISTFDLSKTYINDNSLNTKFKHYEIDFLSSYSPPYSLATILGFNNTTYDTSSNTNGIHKIIGVKTYNTLSSPIYFCFDENQSAIVETHQLLLNNNLSSDKILAKINTYKKTIETNNYIYETLDNIDNKNNVRQYSGPINMSSFTIKIIDNYGLLVQSIQEEFTFDLEIIIQATKLVNKFK